MRGPTSERQRAPRQTVKRLHVRETVSPSRTSRRSGTHPQSTSMTRRRPVKRVQSQTKAEPPPCLNWKPGDPSPQAKDGRRYIMSCSGKVLGMYKPGGAVEMELKTH